MSSQYVMSTQSAGLLGTRRPCTIQPMDGSDPATFDDSATRDPDTERDASRQRQDVAPVALGRLIEQLRLRRGLTSRRRAAQLANLNDSYLAQLERGFVRRRADGTVRPVRMSDGVALKLVWYWGLSQAEQRELFTAAGFDRLRPRPVPPRDELLQPGVLESVLERYSDEELQYFEDVASMYKLRRQGKVLPLPPSRSRAWWQDDGGDGDDQPEAGDPGPAGPVGDP